MAIIAAFQKQAVGRAIAHWAPIGGNWLAAHTVCAAGHPSTRHQAVCPLLASCTVSAVAKEDTPLNKAEGTSR